MAPRTTPEAILGASDGAFTGLGLILGLVTGLSVGGLWHVGLTTAVAGTSSMALGILQADNTYGWLEAVVMGAAWLSMCLAPVLLALVLSGGVLWAMVGVWLLMLGVAMTRARDGYWSQRGLSKTYGLMLAVAIPTTLTAVTI